ncbi:MAG: sodium:calcium antiporter [archaeon]
MLPLIVVIVILFLSIMMIWKGSDWVTDSLIPVAQKLGTSYIAVTTLLVSFTLSLPEIFSAVYSYLLGHQDIGLGVIVGSVIINIGLTVGICAAIKPIKVDKGIVIRDGIYLITIAVIVMVFGSDLTYTRSEGAVLLLLFIPYILNVWYMEKARSIKNRELRIEELKVNLKLIGEQGSFWKIKPSMKAFVLGEIFLVVGSYYFAQSLVDLSGFLHWSDMLIGVVIGAIGTEVPNVVAALQGTLKGYQDVAITETFGSNIFTLLVTLGIFIMLGPFSIPPKIFYFDLVWMIAIHVLTLAFIIKGYKYREESITRLEGVILVLFYVCLLVINTFAFS